jgi:hypothetical protein
MFEGTRTHSSAKKSEPKQLDPRGASPAPAQPPQKEQQGRTEIDENGENAQGEDLADLVGKMGRCVHNADPTLSPLLCVLRSPHLAVAGLARSLRSHLCALPHRSRRLRSAEQDGTVFRLLQGDHCATIAEIQPPAEDDIFFVLPDEAPLALASGAAGPSGSTAGSASQAATPTSAGGDGFYLGLSVGVATTLAVVTGLTLSKVRTPH